MVACLVRDQEAVGSNPATPTITKQTVLWVLSVFLLENMCEFELMASLRANQGEGPGDGAERCRWQIQRGGGREKQGESRSATSERGDYVFLGSRGFKSRHSDHKSLDAFRHREIFLLCGIWILRGWGALRKQFGELFLAPKSEAGTVATQRSPRTQGLQSKAVSRHSDHIEYS